MINLKNRGIFFSWVLLALQLQQRIILIIAAITAINVF